MFSIRAAATLSVGVLMTLAACASGSDGDTAEPVDPNVQTLEVASLDSLKFDPSTLTAQAGEIRIVHDNKGAVVHTFVIDGKLKITDDGEETVTLDPGEYTFHCDVPGHQAAGMEGTLTVTP
jgi:uncharacterized cupredoxin-like copper-binding protein